SPVDIIYPRTISINIFRCSSGVTKPMSVNVKRNNSTSATLSAAFSIDVFSLYSLLSHTLQKSSDSDRPARNIKEPIFHDTVIVNRSITKILQNLYNCPWVNVRYRSHPNVLHIVRITLQC